MQWCEDSSTLITMRALKPMTFALQITRDCFMLQRTVWCADPSRLTIDHCPRDSLLLLAGPMTPSFLSFAPSSSCRCLFLCADTSTPLFFLASHNLSINVFTTTFQITLVLNNNFHFLSNYSYIHAIPCNTMQYHTIPCNTI